MGKINFIIPNKSMNRMSNVIFKKKINKSEKKFSFIHVPHQYRKDLGNSLEIMADGKIFTVKINTVGRLISSKLFKHLDPKIDDSIILEKDAEGRYTITVQPSHMRVKF